MPIKTCPFCDQPFSIEKLKYHIGTIHLGLPDLQDNGDPSTPESNLPHQESGANLFQNQEIKAENNTYLQTDSKNIADREVVNKSDVKSECLDIKVEENNVVQQTDDTVKLQTGI